MTEKSTLSMQKVTNTQAGGLSPGASGDGIDWGTGAPGSDVLRCISDVNGR